MPPSYRPLTTSPPSSLPSSPTLPRFNIPKPRFLRRLDNCLCNAFTYFPLAVVYGLTTWAVWVEAWSISLGAIGGGYGRLLAFVGLCLYGMLSWSYTVATFSSPGTPLESKHSYSHLPTSDITSTSITVKSSGEERYCKKCQCRKPDRTHHCSICNTCVLKMDHHCPWLANCLGLANYKCFVLFLIYLSIFCMFCCAVSSLTLWELVIKNDAYLDTYTPINWVLLAVVSGIVAIVLSGFTGYHLYLISKAETTIESLEKTRYLSPLRRRGGNQSIPLGAIMLNGGPGVLSAEAQSHRERERYNSYIIEETSRSLPNAFNLGWRKNFTQVFGEHTLLCFLPIKNSVGDGWTWETSQVWKDAQRELAEKRRAELMADQERMRRAGWGDGVDYDFGANGSTTAGNITHDWTRQSMTGIPSPINYNPTTINNQKNNDIGASKAARILGAREEEFSHGLGGSRYSARTAMQNREVAVRLHDLSRKRGMVMSRDELSDGDEENSESEEDYETEEDIIEEASRRKMRNGNGSNRVPNLRVAGGGGSVNGVNGSGNNGAKVSTSQELNRREVDTWSDGW